mgnify:FL=1
MNNTEEDRHLVAQVQEGDNAAYNRLFEKYHTKLHTMLSRFVGDSHEAEDIVQESFIKAFKAIKSFRGESAFYTWLYRIGINTAKNQLGAKHKKLTFNADFNGEDDVMVNTNEALHDVDTPEGELFSKQIARALSSATESLQPELSEAITMREIEGKTYAEIASVMNCPIGTVRSRIFRAREALAAKVKPIIGSYNVGRWQ